MLKIRRVCIFAHYDKEGLIDPYVVLYIKSLLPFVNKIIFVSTNLKHTDENYKMLHDMGVRVIIRENTGYDFYSWKIGLDSTELSEYDEVLLVNDSCYAPLFSFENVFKKMDNIDCDFWGLTFSKQIKPHLQSFFVCYKKSIVNSYEFRSFWNKLSIIEDKTDIIMAYEVGLSQVLINNGYRVAAFFHIDLGYYIKSLISYYSHRMVNYFGRSLYFPIKIYKNIKTRKSSHSAMGILDPEHEDSYVDWESLRDRFVYRPFRVLFGPQRIYYWFRNLFFINPSHFFYKEMIEQGIPLIKVELIRDNPVKIKESKLRSIRGVSPEIVDLIAKHQVRVGSKKRSMEWVK